jgi:hypothetical protein
MTSIIVTCRLVSPGAAQTTAGGEFKNNMTIESLTGDQQISIAFRRWIRMYINDVKSRINRTLNKGSFSRRDLSARHG